jgi:putative endopeptidase
MRPRYAIAAAVVMGGVALVGAARQAPVSGLDRTTFDMSVRPADDLFRHVNGGWLARTAIPADRPMYGTFIELIDRAENDLHAIVQQTAAGAVSPDGSPAALIAGLYASFMDEQTVTRLGDAPLGPRLAEIDNIRTTAEFAALVGRLAMTGVPGPIDSYIEADAGDPATVAVYLGQSGTALPDRDYYLSNDPRFMAIREAYQRYLERVFAMASRPRSRACSGRRSRAVTR